MHSPQLAAVCDPQLTVGMTGQFYYQDKGCTVEIVGVVVVIVEELVGTVLFFFACFCTILRVFAHILSLNFSDSNLFQCYF